MNPLENRQRPAAPPAQRPAPRPTYSPLSSPPRPQFVRPPQERRQPTVRPALPLRPSSRPDQLSTPPAAPSRKAATKNPLLFPLLAACLLALLFFGLWLSRPASGSASPLESRIRQLESENALLKANTAPRQDKSGQTADPAKTTTADKNSDALALLLESPIRLSSSTITFHSISFVQDYDGKPALKLIYDWTNEGGQSSFASAAFTLKGFQKGVQTESAYSDAIDYSISLKEVLPGGTVTNAEDGILIADPEAPMTLILEEAFSLSSQKWVMTIDNLSVYR